MVVLDGLRLFFGSVFILFLPGLAWSLVIFARREIDLVERVALSIGLSVAVVPLAIFWFNGVFNVPITLINTVLIVLGLVAGGLLCHLGRKRSWWGRAYAKLVVWFRSRWRRLARNSPADC